MSRSAPLRSVLALALLAVACSGASRAQVSVGQTAPDFTLSDLDGHPVSLASYRGQVVVLEWANPNCPVSRRHADAGTMTSTLSRHPGVVWLAINSTRSGHSDHVDPAEYHRYLSERKIGYPVLLDPTGEVGHAYGARTTPHMFVIDAQGKIAYMGAIDDDPRNTGASVDYVDAALTALEQGRRPDPASTRPYGCSVKY
jgi:peroxiredoxin